MTARRSATAQRRVVPLLPAEPPARDGLDAGLVPAPDPVQQFTELWAVASSALRAALPEVTLEPDLYLREMYGDLGKLYANYMQARARGVSEGAARKVLDEQRLLFHHRWHDFLSVWSAALVDRVLCAFDQLLENAAFSLPERTAPEQERIERPI